MQPAGRLLLILGTVVMMSACGPLSTTTRVSEARVAIAAAEAVGAKEGAVYEYVSALEYLRKAREEEGYSDYQAAIDYAVQARTFAEKALERANARGELGTPPAVAPAAVLPAASPTPVKKPVVSEPIPSDPDAEDAPIGLPSGSAL